MKLRHISSLAVIAAVLFAAPLMRAGDENAQAEKDKKPAKAKHVYTDEDMPSTRDNGSTSTSDAEAKTDEKAPKLSLAEAKKELEDVKASEQALIKALEKVQEKADAATDPFRKNMYLESIERQQITLQEFREKRKKLEEQLAAEKDKKEQQS